MPAKLEASIFMRLLSFYRRRYVMIKHKVFDLWRQAKSIPHNPKRWWARIESHAASINIHLPYNSGKGLLTKNRYIFFRLRRCQILFLPQPYFSFKLMPKIPVRKPFSYSFARFCWQKKLFANNIDSLLTCIIGKLESLVNGIWKTQKITGIFGIAINEDFTSFSYSAILYIFRAKSKK